jgi:glycerate kinase
VKALIAPDKFKDALDAAGVAEALAAGLHDARPEAEVVLCPLGDGGEGTGRLLASALQAQEQSAVVLDPLGCQREARWWLCPDRETAVVEMAEASGLALLDVTQRNALRTTSFGTGQLLRAAQEAGRRRVLLCVGGSATVDGGAGCLQALGWKFLDHSGAAITELLTGGMLLSIARVQSPLKARAGSLDILCDVDNPLLGPRGAAAVFGPQKGVTPAGVRQLERGLAHWADVLVRCGGMDMRALAGGGAAGGLPAGLAAALGARLRPGFAEVARQVGLHDKLAGCDLCLTGEGRIDDQTAGGKVVAGVARLAGEHRMPVLAFTGAVRLRPGQTIEDLARAVGVERIVVISPGDMPLPEALAATAANLRRAAREAMAAYS